MRSDGGRVDEGEGREERENGGGACMRSVRSIQLYRAYFVDFLCVDVLSLKQSS